MESVINIENFYFAYKKSDLVLRDINFEIKKGSFTVITGPSGAGKTTLCKAMTGIVPYYMGGRYSGDVKINGESTKGKRVSDIAMRVGFIMEDYESQLVSLTAGEEIAFSLLNHGFAPHEVEERVKAISWTSSAAVSASVCFWLQRLLCIRRLLCLMSLYLQWTRMVHVPCIIW